MKKIRKRDGRLEAFNKDKVIEAILKAYLSIDEELTVESKRKAREIANYVEALVEERRKRYDVEEIQTLIEGRLQASKRKDVAAEFIRYRYKKSLIRNTRGVYESVLQLVDFNNEELKDENSNKNAIIASTQRDYMAGEVSKDLTRQILLPQHISEAHDDGIIHFHDADYFAQHIHNCFTGGTKLITNEGVVPFRRFKDGEIITVKCADGKLRPATVHTYGEQKFNTITLKTSNRETTVKATANHRWLLDDGTVTTNLKVGDVLQGVVDSTDYEINNQRDAFLFCLGFSLGDGCDVNSNRYGYTQVRLCGDKIKYKEIFELANYRESSQALDGDDVYMTYHTALKQNFINGKAWRLLSADEQSLVFKGYYAADGANKTHRISTSDERYVDFIRETSSLAGYYISNERFFKHDTNFKEQAQVFEFGFVVNQDYRNTKWKVADISNRGPKGLAYCVEEPETHSFTLEGGVVTGNCCLVNLEDMLWNGTVINGTLIERPKSFSTASTVATQIMACIASGQYGGQSVNLSALAPFVDITRQKYRKEFDDETAEKLTLMDVKRGVQIMQYQINTLNTSNGQTPFVTVFMYLNGVEEGRTKDDFAIIIEEVLKQRILGVKNEVGEYITPAFPKLIYVLEEDNITEDSKYWYLTELAAECSAKRLVPDYISEKVMLELKGDCYSVMGCRSALTPDRFTDTGIGNISKAKNYVEGEHKYSGRFNQGVVTINLPDVALSAKEDNPDDVLEAFWTIFDERLELCHEALRLRHERLLGTPSDVSPIHWQHGGLARLDKGETIDKLLYNGYSTISLGYAGLWECVYALTGEKLTEPLGKEIGFKIMQTMNDYCAKWKAAENIDYSIYGTPIESTTYKFAKCLKKRFGIVEGVTDRDYITNSYHIHVTEPIDAFSKLAIEGEFQALSPGGAVSYVEIPDMKKNIPAVLALIKFIYNNIMYAELNTKSDYCMVCGFDGEMEIVDKNNKLDWRCPECGNMDHSKLNIARRTCGYIGSQFWNQGRTSEIHDRVLHL